MQISIVTDEISADPETAFELGVEWGIRHFELRGYGEDRVPNFSDFQKQRIRECLEMFGVDVVAISPGLFKIPFPPANREHFPLRTFDSNLYGRWRSARDLLRYHQEELLPKSIEYAKSLNVTQIVAFSFHRGGMPAGSPPDEILDVFHRAAIEAGQAGIDLVVEVEDEFWADTGARTAELVKRVAHPAFGVNWDPGNAFPNEPEPFPGGYEAVRSYVRHVHFKDVLAHETGYNYTVHGQIDWAGQIAALRRDGYAGYISVETHMEPKVRAARDLTERLKALIADATTAP